MLDKSTGFMAEGTDSLRPYYLAPAIEANMTTSPHLADFSKLGTRQESH